MTDPVLPHTPPRLARSALAFTLLAAFLGWMLDGAEQGIFPLVARPALQQMLSIQGDREVGIWMGYLTAVFLLGAAAGGAVFGWLGDRVGRVRAMSLSILAYSLFTGLCYFAVQPWQLGVFRFLASLGMGGQWSLGVALVMETWPEQHRPWLAGAIGAAANIGFMLIGAVGYFFPVTSASWRWIMLVGAAPAALTFLIRMYVPESDRWKAASQGPVKAQPLREIFSPGVRRRTAIGIAVSAFVLIGTWGSVQWLPTWADKLTGGAAPQAKAVTAMLLGAGATFGGFFGAMLGRAGRRISYFILCLLSYALCWVMYHQVQSYGLEFQVLTFFIGIATASFYGWLPLYLPELFATRIRATAQGVSYNSGRILAAVGALGAGQVVAYYGGSYARMGAMITCVYFVGAAFIWLAPETKGQRLPD